MFHASREEDMTHRSGTAITAQILEAANSSTSQNQCTKHYVQSHGLVINRVIL
jgi:hypothetical protein